MKQRTQYSQMRTFFDRYHHFILTGLCLLFIAISFAITGCDTINSDDRKESSAYDRQIAELRQAVEPFADFEAARVAGYTIAIPSAPLGCTPIGIRPFRVNMQQNGLTDRETEPKITCPSCY